MEQNTEAFEAAYKTFVEKAAANRSVWGLKGKGGWANAESSTNEENAVIPFWNDRTQAKNCARDDWKGFLPTEILLSDFLENWCIEMAGSDAQAGINWNAQMQGIEVEALDLAVDILNRLSEINSGITFSGYSSINEFISDISEE
ncbi:DUF2750 domain-containing protein [Mucilaginibacter conchicola]|uniref:DUF2750 domain-containing protein n=1 Tax=Mucilaginibacter conchicola TaxID=2303333 RepID=A0A372NPW3_9SPHI|nr:DUF2750 domain-containing protein [Mucilaginibacter conchicola]RFZ90415.1 DUF2750 domain-containing protein [Mucilaginibacter conchicola]